MKRSLKSGEEFLVDLARFLALPSRERLDELSDFGGKEIGRDADHPDRTDREKRQGQRIIAAQDGETIRQRGATSSLTRSTLPLASLIETIFGQSSASLTTVFGGDINATAPWDVVEHELERGCLGDGGEMAEESFLARLVVVGRDEERAIRADFLPLPGVCDRVAG